MIFWKQSSCEQELQDEMEKAQQDAIVKEESSQGALILQAMSELNAAAQSFEQSGRVTRAKEVTLVMISLASDEDREKSKSKKDVEDAAKHNADEVVEVFKFFGFSPEEFGKEED